MKSLRSIFIICIFVVLNAIVLKAYGGNKELLTQAEQAYTSGQYTEALDLWARLYAEGYSDPQLLVNMGHAHAFMGNTAEAMTAYEKALRFRPADQEIKVAINQLRERNENSVERVEPFFISSWLDIFLSLVRPYVWALAGLLFLLAGLINWLSGLNLIKGRWRFTKGKFQVYGIIGFMFIAISFLSYRNIYRLNEAIVYTGCDIYQGPSGQSPLVRSIYEGEKVKCKDHITGWTKVQLMNLDEGWIKDECIRIIDLRDRN